jgi:hypothetical protein
MTASVVQWPEFLATYPEVPGSVPVLPDFLRSSKSGTRITEELLEWNSSGRGNPLR